MVPIDGTSFNDLASSDENFSKFRKSALSCEMSKSIPATLYHPRKRLKVKNAVHCSVDSTEECRSQCENASGLSSVPDPDPNPDPDPHVFGPPGSGSGSASQRYGSGSGSGSFYHHAKIVRKTLIPSSLRLFLTFLSLKNDVNVPSKSNKQKKLC